VRNARGIAKSWFARAIGRAPSARIAGQQNYLKNFLYLRPLAELPVSRVLAVSTVRKVVVAAIVVAGNTAIDWPRKDEFHESQFQTPRRDELCESPILELCWLGQGPVELVLPKCWSLCESQVEKRRGAF